MATEEKYSLSPELTGWLGEYLNSLGVESIEELRQKLGKAEGGKTEIVKVETNIYDKEEIYPDCTNRRFHIPDLADICMSAEEFCCLGERKDNG